MNGHILCVSLELAFRDEAWYLDEPL